MLKISVLKDGERVVLSACRGESLSEVLKRKGLLISQPCGGKGKCGKCRVKVFDMSYPYDETDIKLLGEKNVHEGLRLLCRMKAIKDIKIELDSQKKFDVLDSFDNKYLNYKSDEEGYGVCVDIGTTTVAAQLVRLSDGKIVKSCGRINSQNVFGADVVSRIEASLKGNSKELKMAVTEDIMKCLFEICTDVKRKEIKKIILAGNTAMTYFLLGKDCEGISKFPFKCDFSDLKEYNFSDIFENNEFEARVYVVNCLSAFVGGDIVSGIVFCNLLENKNCLFIDIGTNAEMAVFNSDKLFITSAPAGPTFEGGGISCGTGSVAGAICSASLKSGIWSYETIAEEKAFGICGSGLIDIIAALLENGIIDKDGLMSEKYFKDGIKIGKIVKLTQRDIREFQLAKAAVRAGIKILLKKAAIKPRDIEKIFVAGGFGSKINPVRAFKAGLFPPEFEGRLYAVGNSALGGLRDIALNNPEKYIQKIKNFSVDINLAQTDGFNQLFMEEMSF